MSVSRQYDLQKLCSTLPKSSLPEQHPIERGMQSFVAKMLVFALILHTLPGHAWPPDFAPEFNFTNKELESAWSRQPDRTDTSNPTSERYREFMLSEIKRRCSDCTYSPGEDRYGIKKYRVTYLDGWWFEITLDPSVIEIISKPATLSAFQQMQSRLQNHIFDAADALGLRSALAGHINVGTAEGFGGDTRLFRNFIVDLLNHPGMMKQIMHTPETFNAPHIESLKPDQINAFRQLISTYNTETGNIPDFAKRLQTEVYHHTTWDAARRGEPPTKYHAVNINSNVAEDSWPRVELRAVRRQANVAEFILMAELIEARLAYLKGVSGLVPYTVNAKSFENSVRNSEAAVEEFYRYVSEANLDWNRFRSLVPSEFSASLQKWDAHLAANGQCLQLNQTAR